MPRIGFTNRKNYPEYVVDACKKVSASYDKGDADYSVTTIIDSPRIHFLKERHDYTEDVDALLKATWGTILHSIYEDTTQQRLFYTVGTVVISGLPDRVDCVSLGLNADDATKYPGYGFQTVLRDIKFTDKKSNSNPALKLKWEQQLNIYRAMHHLRIDALFIDQYYWDHTNASRLPKINTWEAPLWDLEYADRFIGERVEVFEAEKLKPDADLCLCLSSETWYGARCRLYCPVADVCKQLLSHEPCVEVE